MKCVLIRLSHINGRDNNQHRKVRLLCNLPNRRFSSHKANHSKICISNQIKVIIHNRDMPVATHSN